jgi:glucosyl-dolichyl phosphate glucuronosyltransferase
MTGLTVAVPTRNRRLLLLGALEAIAGQLRPGDELVVVDNGSTDGSGEAAWSFLAARAAAGRVVVEPEGGISSARNRALVEAATEIVCFVDDDVRVEPGWLEALRNAWASSDGRTACIGGPMLADWEVPRPAWLADHLLYVVAVLDLGGEARRLDQSPGTGHVWGGNFSVRVGPVQEIGGFDVHRGLRPEAPRDRGEEEDVQRRLAAAGWDVWYEPAARVRHLIPAERLREDFFAEAFRARGRAEAQESVSRARGLATVMRGVAHYGLLRALGRPEAAAARFTCAYGWALLTARGRRPARPPAVTL